MPKKEPICSLGVPRPDAQLRNLHVQGVREAARDQEAGLDRQLSKDVHFETGILFVTLYLILQSI